MMMMYMGRSPGNLMTFLKSYFHLLVRKDSPVRLDSFNYYPLGSGTQLGEEAWGRGARGRVGRSLPPPKSACIKIDKGLKKNNKKI